MRRFIYILLAFAIISAPALAAVDDIVVIGEPVIGDVSASDTWHFGIVNFMFAPKTTPPITKPKDPPITKPGTQPVVVVPKTPPTISDVYVGNRLYHKNLVDKGDKVYVSKSATIKATIKAEDGIDTNNISMILNNTKTINLSDSHILSKTVNGGKVTQCNISYKISGFELGENTVVLNAENSGGKTSETLKMTVLQGVSIIGDVVFYPSPFSITRDKTAYIQYTLSDNTNLTIYVVSVSGATLKKFDLYSGAEGGSAGRNKVAWDGRADSGSYLGNGIYVGIIVHNGKILKRFKFTIKD